MKTFIEHPYIRVEIELPGSVTVAEDLMSSVQEMKAFKKRLLLWDKKKIGQIIVADDPNFGTELNQQTFEKIFLVRGLISDFTKEGFPVNENGLTGKGWTTEFKVDGVPHSGHVRCYDVPTEVSGKQGMKLVLAVWGSANDIEIFQEQILESAETIHFQKPEIVSATFQRSALLFILASNGIQSLLSLVSFVPVYGTSTTGEPYTFLSFFALGMFTVFTYGVYKRRGWGVFGSAIMLGVISFTGLLSLFTAETSSTSSYYYYIPAIREGGIHSYLWVQNIILNIIAPVIAFVYHERLIYEEFD